MNLVFKALSDPTRRRVLQLLRERPLTAGDLADQFVVSKSTMSAHFAVLQAAGLIEAEKVGRTVYYRLKMSVLEDALLGFTGTAPLQAWQADARPVPVSLRDAAQAAVHDGADALVLDLAGPVPFAIEGDDLQKVAEGWQLATVGPRTAWVRP